MRECPNGNWHFKWSHVCLCCRGPNSEYAYKWHRKQWLPVEWATTNTGQANMLSMSGQLTTGDLLWNGLKTGLIIGLFVVLISLVVLRSIDDDVKKIQQDKINKSALSE